MLLPPPGIIWDNTVSEFLDSLIELDIRYIEAQVAMVITYLTQLTLEGHLECA